LAGGTTRAVAWSARFTATDSSPCCEELLFFTLSADAGMLVRFPALVLLVNTPAPPRCSTLCCAQNPPPSSRGREVPGIGGRVSRDADKEYLAALQDARRAAERLQRAERDMSDPFSPPERPVGARTTISRSDAGTLLVDVPAAGLNAGTLFGGAFSVAWFSAIVPATFASGGAATLFMLPFWLAGGLVAKQTLFDPARATGLSIGEFGWELRQTLAGSVGIKSESGPTEELEGAEVAVAAYVNGLPTYVLRLGAAGGRTYALGGGLSASELEWLAGVINGHLAALGDATRDGRGGGGVLGRSI
jgi:hypothetical protein